MQKTLLAAELMLGGDLNQGQSSVLEPAVITSH